MSLMICPDCGHEVSTGATACPNCAHPFVLPNTPPPRTVIVDNTPDRESGFPTWAYLLFGILGVCLLFGVIFLVKQNNDDAANSTVGLDVRGKQSSNSSKEVTRTPTQTVSVPAATDSQTVSVPAPATTTSTTSIESSTTTNSLRKIQKVKNISYCNI